MDARMATQVVARDDGRIGDEMTLEGIAKQLEKIQSDIAAVRSDIGAVRSDVGGVRSELHSEASSLRSELHSEASSLRSELHSEASSLRSDIKAVDGKVDSLDHKMTIEFEETRRVVRLGFESVEILDEKIDRRFDDSDRAHADHKSLLEAALVRVRRDLTKRPPGRRR